MMDMEESDVGEWPVDLAAMEAVRAANEKTRMRTLAKIREHVGEQAKAYGQRPEGHEVAAGLAEVHARGGFDNWGPLSSDLADVADSGPKTDVDDPKESAFTLSYGSLERALVEVCRNPVVDSVGEVSGQCQRVLSEVAASRAPKDSGNWVTFDEVDVLPEVGVSAEVNSSVPSAAPTLPNSGVYKRPVHAPVEVVDAPPLSALKPVAKRKPVIIPPAEDTLYNSFVGARVD
jgi:hypothetical protein